MPRCMNIQVTIYLAFDIAVLFAGFCRRRDEASVRYMLGADRHDLDTLPFQAIEKIESIGGSNPSLSAKQTSPLLGALLFVDSVGFEPSIQEWWFDKPAP